MVVIEIIPMADVLAEHGLAGAPVVELNSEVVGAEPDGSGAPNVVPPPPAQ